MLIANAYELEHQEGPIPVRVSSGCIYDCDYLPEKYCEASITKCARTGCQEPHKKQIGLVVVPGKHFVKCELLTESEPPPDSGSDAEENCDGAPDLMIAGTAL